MFRTQSNPEISASNEQDIACEVQGLSECLVIFLEL